MERGVTEKILLNRLAEGDQAAFRTLYDQHRDKLFYYVLKITGSRQIAEDLLQEVFVKLWLDRAVMGEVRSFSAWMFRMIRNKTINVLRRQAHESQILAAITVQQQEGDNNTADTLRFNETQKVLQEAIGQLPPQQQLVYRLQREHGLKNEEIALHLNISPLTVKKHIAQAARSIRGMMQQYSTVSLFFAVFFFV